MDTSFGLGLPRERFAFRARGIWSAIRVKKSMWSPAEGESAISFRAPPWANCEPAACRINEFWVATPNVGNPAVLRRSNSLRYLKIQSSSVMRRWSCFLRGALRTLGILGLSALTQARSKHWEHAAASHETPLQ